MKNKMILSVVFLLIFITILSSTEADVSYSGDYIIDGSDVYIDNDKAYIRAPNEIYGSGWTYLNFTAKQFTGDIDLAVGFDTTHLKPKRAELYKPHLVYQSKTRTIYNVTNYYIHDGTGELDVGEYNVRNTKNFIIEYSQPNYNSSCDPTFENCIPDNYTTKTIITAFNSTSLVPSEFEVGENYSITWYTEKLENWVDITDKFGDLPESIHNNFDDKNKWYYVKDQPITAGTEYQIRIFVNAPPQLGENVYKYDVVMKPSGQNFAQANSNENLFVLDPLWNTSWNRLKEMTINQSMVSQSIGTGHFHLLISITDPNLANYAQIDGDDIVFTNAANDTQLPHKIEYWNKTTGVLVACVNVTDITNVSSINMYYDNPSAINSENPEGVWDSNFLMVHHLQETDIDGGAGDIIDDTSNNNDGTTYNMTGDNQVPGMIDGAFDYDGINEYLIVNAFSDDMVTTKAYTISYVLNTTQSDVTWTSRHIAIYNDALTDGFATTHTSDGKIFVYTSGGSTLTESTAGTAINDGEPHLITAIFDQPNDIVSIYVDGELDYQVTSYTDNSAMTDTKIYIAISPAYEVGYEGIFDEIRISDIGRSAEWIRTGYNNTKYPELFIDVGAEQSTPTAEPNITSWQNSKTINNILDFTLNTSERVNFNVTANQSIASWNWDKNDVNQLHNYNNMSTSFQTTGLHIVTVNVTNINGTSNSIQWNVTVNNHDSWSHWKEITINDTMVDQTIGDVHFPLLVHITDTDLRDEAQANGYDIVFTNTEDTEQYAHQIEGNFNSTTGELKARVHIQDISNVSSIRMWYGNSGATNTEDKAGTWGENASGIWLFDEGEGSCLNDSSGNDNNGTIYGADWVDDELNFVSTNSDYVDCGNDSSVHITTDISIEAHINATSWISEANIISFSNGGETSDVNSFYGFVVVNDPGDILLGHEYNDGVNQYHVFNTNLAVDTDYRLYAVRDSTAKTWTLYIDGEQFDSAYTYTNNPTGGENNLLLMGKTPYTVDPLFFDGKIKDVSVFDIVHSASYISTIYNNSAYPALFISLGDEQGIPPDPINLLNTTGKFWVNYTWSPGSGTITDSYNVSYNATWDNSSSNTYRNESVGAHGYLDIIVYAYNISTNALSAGYVTDNVTVPNNVPVLSDVSASYNLYENETFYIDANHTDYDGDTITYIDNASEWDINSATGEVSWVLDWEDVADSPYSYRITIDDGYGGTDYQDFTVTINGMQNTALTSVDTTFETGTPGTDFTANTITLSFYLVNSGSIDADISAKFTSNYETTYGLVSGTSTIGGSNFKLGNATLDALLDNGNSVDLTDNVPGEDTQRNYEVQLRVPAGQDALSYSGAIELTFSDV